MKSERDLNKKIFEITMLIQNKHPELWKYLNEMPVTVPIVGAPKINSESLQEYYNSLDQMVQKYLLEHPQKKILM